VWGLRYALDEVLVHLRVTQEGVSHGVVEADPREVGVAGVAGEADLRDQLAIAEDDIVRIAHAGGASSLLGAIVGEAIGEGGGVHRADTMTNCFIKSKKKGRLMPPLLLVKHFRISILVQLQDEVSHSVIRLDAHGLVAEGHLAEQFIALICNLSETYQGSNQWSGLHGDTIQRVDRSGQAVIHEQTILGGQLVEQVILRLGQVGGIHNNDRLVEFL